MAAKWNLRNFEVFCHRGYNGDNKMPGFVLAAEKGYNIEADIVQTSDGVVVLKHDRTVTIDGTSYNVSDITKAQLDTVDPNCPTLAEFITFLQEYPNVLVNLDAYAGGATAFAAMHTAGVLDRVLLNTNSPDSATVDTYPELSYNILNFAEGSVESDWDFARTPQNIISFNGTSNPGFPVMGMYKAKFSAEDLATAIENGVTWFQCDNADEVAEMLKSYTAPGYSQAWMLGRIADAIRGKNGSTDEIAARNYPSQIRKLTTQAEGTETSLFDWKCYANAYNMSNIRGDWTAFAEVNLDMNSLALAVPSISYVAFSPNGCVINISNCATATLPSDFLRSAHGISEVNFVDGIYPSGTLNRFGRAVNVGNSISEGNYEGGLTITGLYLDNITGFNALLSSASGNVNIVWEGTLNASVNISSATALTADSVNRLISCLADYSAGEAHTLTMGATLLAKVTDESKAIATARNWTLA